MSFANDAIKDTFKGEGSFIVAELFSEEAVPILLV